jgi:hypothetical protein
MFKVGKGPSVTRVKAAIWQMLRRIQGRLRAQTAKNCHATSLIPSIRQWLD